MSVNRLRLHGARGMSVLELLMALSVAGIASGIAFASVDRSVSATREAGAARAFAMRVRQTRLEAIQRSAGVALHFVTTPSAPSFRAYVDGNGNGVRTREIASGVDPPLGPVAALNDGLGGVRFARAPDIPAVGDDDGGPSPAGGAGAGGAGAGGGAGDGGAADGSAEDPSDAIRLGAAGLLSFAPMGSGTSGTIYLRGATRQFAVRIYGPTGRVRLMEFDRSTRVWLER
jgi:prepilin-type N-terminal cleavage/methylation domain-containing protein